ncbi:MAG: ABC transporter substrate-binding protein [Deltaproteobacteria bacterium]|nr:ABC transporter substrate-binding protein [Deltaproteobacteria bacterium]
MKKKRLISGVTLGLIVAMTISIPTIWAQSKQKSTHQWVWTQKNPKPNWWKWDETYYPSKPVRGGYFRTASLVDLGLMNPNHWPVNNWSILEGIYDRLIYSDGQYRPIIPWLAKSWKYTSPLTVTIKLKKGIRFHDGSPFNAKSVKYQFDWIKDPANGAWSRAWIKPIKSVQVVDNYTVRFHLKQTWSSFLDKLSMVPGWMMSTKALKGDAAVAKYESLEDQLYDAKEANRPAKEIAALEKQVKKAEEAAKTVVSLDEWAVGSGPYMVEENRPGNYVKLKRNPNWWFGKSIGKPDMPYFDGTITMVIPESSVQLANLKAGKIDSMVVDPVQYNQVKDDPNLNVYITPSNFTIFLTFNHKEGPCKDIRVRKAISHAIDRKAMIAAAAGGFGRPASCLFPDDHWAHNPNLKPVDFDPELSKKLLAEAGYAKGVTLRGGVLPISASIRFSQAVKAMLKRVNINWDVKILDSVALADQYRNMEYEVGVFVATYIKDPDAVLSSYYDPEAQGNMGRSNNKKANQLMEAARRELNFEKRKKIYYDVEKALYDNYEDAWMWHYTWITATRKQVLGYNREMQIAGGNAYWPTHPQWFKDGKSN